MAEDDTIPSIPFDFTSAEQELRIDQLPEELQKKLCPAHDYLGDGVYRCSCSWVRKLKRFVLHSPFPSVAAGAGPGTLTDPLHPAVIKFLDDISAAQLESLKEDE